MRLPSPLCPADSPLYSDSKSYPVGLELLTPVESAIRPLADNDSTEKHRWRALGPVDLSVGGQRGTRERYQGSFSQGAEKTAGMRNPPNRFGLLSRSKRPAKKA